MVFNNDLNEISINASKPKDDPLYHRSVALIKANQMEEAIEILGELLERSVGTFGELDVNVAPIYYKYGSAILCKVENESNVFGEVSRQKIVESKKTAETEDEKCDTKILELSAAPEIITNTKTEDQMKTVETVDNAIVDSIDSNNDEVVENAANNPSEPTVVEDPPPAAVAKETDKELKEVEVENIISNKSNDNNQSNYSTNNVIVGEGDDTAAVTNKQDSSEQAEALADDLQVSWECLEMARVIYSKNCMDRMTGVPNSSIYLELATVLMRLADHNMESGNFEAAIADYTIALQIREKNLPNINDRLMADSHCSKAVAHTYYSNAIKEGSQGKDTATLQDKRKSELSKAMEHYKQARGTINAIIFMLKEEMKATSTSKSDEVTDVEKDNLSKLAELEQVVVDLSSYITDLELESSDQVDSAVKEARAMHATGGGADNNPKVEIGFSNHQSVFTSATTTSVNVMSTSSISAGTTSTLQPRKKKSATDSTTMTATTSMNGVGDNVAVAKPPVVSISTEVNGSSITTNITSSSTSLESKITEKENTNDGGDILLVGETNVIASTSNKVDVTGGVSANNISPTSSKSMKRKLINTTEELRDTPENKSKKLRESTI